MYPEVAVLSGMFMISPTTVQREIWMLLPLLWHYFKGQVQWPTHQQWLHMAHHWELFPGDSTNSSSKDRYFLKGIS